MKKRAMVIYTAYHKNGKTQASPCRTFGFLGLVWELWCFWRMHGTGLDDYDSMNIAFCEE